MVIVRLLLLSIIIFCSKSQAEQLRIAASANFTVPLELLIAEFKQSHNIDIQVSTASTGVLYQQIRHGAPFDMLFAADVHRPELLEQQGLIHHQFRKTYALGQLALWAPNRTSPITLTDLATYQGRLAIAAPHIAPYGKATKEVLIKLNLWKDFQSRLITGNNINQTYQQAMTGAVTYSFVAASQLIFSEKGVGIIIDTKFHEPIEQQMVILKKSNNLNLAEKFFNFVLSERAQKIIQKAGYIPVVNLSHNHIRHKNLKG